MIPELGIMQHVQVCECGIAAVMMCPATAVNGERSQNNSGSVGTDGTIKPVFTIDHVYPIAVGHHVPAAVRQTDEVPETAFVSGNHFSGQPAHGTGLTEWKTTRPRRTGTGPP